MTIGPADTACMDMIQRMEKEKELVGRLAELLKEEVGFITNQNVEALEESMPEKHKILHDIAANRQGGEDFQEEPLPQFASQIKHLKMDLVRLWKKASGLNELSKTMVTSRLAEIEQELEPFFAGSKTGYTREGKKSRGGSRTLNTGV